jgi:hypothetical protein
LTVLFPIAALAVLPPAAPVWIERIAINASAIEAARKTSREIAGLAIGSANQTRA